MKLLKYFVRSVVGTILSPVGNYLTKNKLTIFCYHDVSSSPSEFSHKYDLNVSPDTFDFQIDFINKNFNVISPDDLSTNKMPKNAKTPLVGLLVLLVLVLGSMMGWWLTSWTLCPCSKSSKTVPLLPQNCCFHNIQTKPLHKTQHFWRRCPRTTWAI